jgi:hypothetical protein
MWGCQVLVGEKLDKKSQRIVFEIYPQILKGFLLIYQNDVPIL